MDSLSQGRLRNKGLCSDLDFLHTDWSKCTVEKLYSMFSLIKRGGAVTAIVQWSTFPQSQSLTAARRRVTVESPVVGQPAPIGNRNDGTRA